MQKLKWNIKVKSKIRKHNKQLKRSLHTIGKYSLAFDGTNFILQNKTTSCLAQDKCGIPQEKQKIKLSQLQTAQTSSCSPNAGCC